ncbi:MAG: malectin domain-containing carbohydrate-binding protein, partial [Flavobacteriaceae bacterium]
MKNHISLLTLFACGLLWSQQQTNDQYINMGGPDVYHGNQTFFGDENAGISFNSNQTYSIGSGSVTVAPSIFHSERFGATIGGTLSYNVPMADGTYTVRTYHNELYFGVNPTAPAATTGQRVYDITVEGVLKVDDFDLFTANRNQPYVHTFENVSVSGGVLTIDLAASVQRAQICGFSVEGPNGTHYYNAGGQQNVVLNGNTFVGDKDLGRSASNVFTNTAASSEALFQRERYRTGSSDRLSYSIPVANGTYTVTTLHNELWFGKHASAPAAGPGKRVFHIDVEGNREVTDFDIYQQGNSDHSNVMAGISVSDGKLDIDLVAVSDNPQICGIAIEGPENHYINVGGSTSATYNGKQYLVEDDVLFNSNSHLTYTHNIVNADLLESERYASTGNLEIGVPVENGFYTVKTYHNELWFGVHASAAPFQDDQRMFDIELEGTVVQQGFDLYDHSVNGAITPTVRTFQDIEVTDGQLDLALRRITGKDNPHLHGLAILKQDGVIGPGEGPEEPLAYTTHSLSDENYVMTRTYHAPMSSFVPVNEQDVLESVTYYDGLGRPMQQLGIKMAGDKDHGAKDLVAPVGYDSFGRMDKEWLPYEATTGTLGHFRTGAEAAARSWYHTTYAPDFSTMDATTANAYSEKELEISPLNRVLKQAAPGEAWKMDGGHEIEFEYRANTHDASNVAKPENDNVRLYRVSTVLANGIYTPTLQNATTTTAKYYAAGELFKNVTKDENHTSGKLHSMEEFVDKKGRTILKRTYAMVGASVTAHD